MPNKKKKEFRRSSLGHSSVCQLKHKNQSAMRKQWTEEQMSAALNSVNTEGLSGNRAADLYGVPRSTLKDQLSGRVVHGSLFGPLKQQWQEACHKFYQIRPSKVISKLNFSSVFRNAWLSAVTPANICGGFKKARVFPFNRDAVSLPENSSVYVQPVMIMVTVTMLMVTVIMLMVTVIMLMVTVIMLMVTVIMLVTVIVLMVAVVMVSTSHSHIPTHVVHAYSKSHGLEVDI